MLCLKPYRIGITEFGCGRCDPCLINRKRLWTARMMLESYQHEASCFATFTFDEDHFPVDGSLSIRDYQLLLKRLRARVGKFRYYLVGEYGDVNWRPHYHAAIFGYRPPDHVNPDRRRIVCHCAVCESWGLGNVYIGDLTPESAGYIVGYILKRMTNTKILDPRLKGRYPEFARMSLKPGIGAASVDVIADFLTSEHGSKVVLENSDVSGTVRLGGRIFPLGRYLKGLLREAIGMPDRKQPADAMKKWQLELKEKLRTVESRDARESKRIQDGRVASARIKFIRSKKGLGV